MAFAQTIHFARGRRNSGDDSSSSSSDDGIPGATAAAPLQPPRSQQRAHHDFDYAHLVMTRDGSNLLSFPAQSVAGRSHLTNAPVDAELDLFGLPPSNSSSEGNPLISPPTRPFQGSSNSQDDAYSSISEIFSPSGLSASEREPDAAQTDSDIAPLADTFQSIPSTGLNSSAGTTGTGGWARWATARAAWVAASNAAAQARRPSVTSLASSASADGLPVRARPRSQRSVRTQQSQERDPSSPRASQASLTSSWSWASAPSQRTELVTSRVPTASRPEAETSAQSAVPRRGMTILDELDLFDDEIEAVRRGGASPARSFKDTLPSRSISPATTFSRALSHPDEELMGAGTPRRRRSIGLSRTPSCLHMGTAAESVLTGEPLTWSELPGSFPTSEPQQLAPGDLTRIKSSKWPRSHRTPSLKLAAQRVEQHDGSLDNLLAGAPAAESAGLHKQRKRGTKRTRRVRPLQQISTSRQQSDPSRVWSRLHGDYGQFNQVEATYSSDSDVSAVARGSKRSNTSASTTTTTRLHHRTTNAITRRGRARGRNGLAGRQSVPTPAQVVEEPVQGEAQESSWTSPRTLVNALWRKVFAVDQDVLDEFAAANPSSTYTTQTQTPMGVSRPPSRKFAYGEGGPEATECFLASTARPSAEHLSFDEPPSEQAASQQTHSTPTIEVDPAEPSMEPMVLDYMLPLPFIDELEKLANAARARRAQRAEEAKFGPSLNVHGQSLHEPSTCGALHALLGSVGTHLSTQVGRHLFFLSFAQGWIARALPSWPTSDQDLPLADQRTEEVQPARPKLPRSYSSISTSSRDTIARYQLGGDRVPQGWRKPVRSTAA